MHGISECVCNLTKESANPKNSTLKKAAEYSQYPVCKTANKRAERKTPIFIPSCFFKIFCKNPLKKISSPNGAAISVSKYTLRRKTKSAFSKKAGIGGVTLPNKKFNIELKRTTTKNPTTE